MVPGRGVVLHEFAVESRLNGAVLFVNAFRMTASIYNKKVYAEHPSTRNPPFRPYEMVDLFIAMAIPYSTHKRIWNYSKLAAYSLEFSATDTLSN